MVLAGPGVGDGHLEAHLGGPAVGVQQGGRHLDLVLHQQPVQSDTDLANQAVVQEPGGPVNKYAIRAPKAPSRGLWVP